MSQPARTKLASYCWQIVTKKASYLLQINLGFYFWVLWSSHVPTINRNEFQSSLFPDDIQGWSLIDMIWSEEMEGLSFSINEIPGNHQLPIKNNPVALPIQILNSQPLHLPGLTFTFSKVWQHFNLVSLSLSQSTLAVVHLYSHWILLGWINKVVKKAKDPVCSSTFPYPLKYFHSKWKYAWEHGVKTHCSWRSIGEALWKSLAKIKAS